MVNDVARFVWEAGNTGEVYVVLEPDGETPVMVGKRAAAATPPAFRDVLLAIAWAAR